MPSIPPTPTPKPAPVPATQWAMVTTGQGGYERLSWSERPTPVPGPGEVLLQVLAAGINNTDINTRVGWYGPGWSGATPFPLIQGADCCGRVAAVGPGVDPARVGERVLVRTCMRVAGFQDPATRWLGTDFDGAFAQFVVVPATEAFAVRSRWSDAELASVPCAWGTAENMLQRAGVTAGERVLVTGASGGVGSAAVQLALARGAHVVAQTSADKIDAVRALGAQQVLTRDADLAQALGADALDAIVDNVAGEGFGARLAALRRGGRLVTSGAIAGAEVALDLRTLYLRDLRLIGCTAWDELVFPRLVSLIEQDAVRPLVARCLPLQAMAQAQREFLARRHVGNFVLIPPAP